MLTRRALVAGAGGLVLAGCDAIATAPAVKGFLRDNGQAATYGWQRLIQGGGALAREYTTADLSPVFKANGSTDPRDAGYRRHVDEGFANWRLVVDGLVARPLSVSLAQLKALPARTQITRHDCVEGWSAIGQWSGPPLGTLLRAAGLRPEARFVVLHCADTLSGADAPYYESIDLADAFHPQTILAHAMNGAALPVAYGAPVRLRVERQLGYKHAKYVMRIEAVDRLDRFGRGHGSFWADRGYEWYAGI